MLKTAKSAQLLLRWALSIGFILPVLDRLGAFGAPEDPHVAWGDWSTFAEYTHQLMPYVDLKTASIFGMIATIIEVICALFLMIGYRIQYTALTSFFLTLIFALSMLIFLHIRAPFNYSVFVVAFSSLLLAALPPSLRR